MNTKAKRIAIALFIGWIPPKIGSVLWTFNNEEKWADEDHLPKPDQDLNIVHEAESKMNNEQLLEYDRMLHDITRTGTRVCDFSAYPGDFTWHIDATQRTDALIKAIGKWTDV